jgi:DNA-binding IclR family transcriptional regulator
VTVQRDAAPVAEEKPYVVQAGAKVLDLLDAFDAPESRRTLTELSRMLALPKSSVLRLLRTVESRGYIERAGDGHGYQLGLKLFALGSRVAQRFDVIEAARPVMGHLREVCGDAVNLGILTGSEVVYVAVLDSPHRLRKTTIVGDREPAYCTALGRAILAHLPLDDLEALLGATDLRPLTGTTVTDVATLRTYLARVKQQGFALDDEETTVGARCVGAPIFDFSGDVRAGISVSGPAMRLTGARLAQVANHVRLASHEISRRLGHTATRGTPVAYPASASAPAGAAD